MNKTKHQCKEKPLDETKRETLFDVLDNILTGLTEWSPITLPLFGPEKREIFMFEPGFGPRAIFLQVPKLGNTERLYSRVHAL